MKNKANLLYKYYDRLALFLSRQSNLGGWGVEDSRRGWGICFPANAPHL